MKASPKNQCFMHNLVRLASIFLFVSSLPAIAQADSSAKNANANADYVSSGARSTVSIKAPPGILKPAPKLAQRLPSSPSSSNPPGGTNSGPPVQNPAISSPSAQTPGLSAPPTLPFSGASGVPGNPELFSPTSIPEGVPSPRIPITSGSALGPAATKTGEPDASGISANQRKEDYDVINTQAENFRRRFLQGEAIELKLPMGDQLMPLGSKLPPIRLEATYTQPISLRETVSYCLDNNLAIRIQGEQVQSNKWLTAAQFGRYLPNALMSYRSQYQAGTTLVGGIIPTKFATPFTTIIAGFQFFGFQGGAVTFNMLANFTSI